MSYCLRHKNGEWVAGLNLVRDDLDRFKKVSFITKDNPENSKFFKDILTIYDDIVRGAERSCPVGTMALDNYEELKKHFMNVDECEIWYNHYMVKQKYLKICPIKINEGLFIHLFKKSLDKILVESILPYTSKKLMLRYDLVVRFELDYNDLEKIDDDLKSIGLNFHPLKIAPGQNIRFFLMNQEDLNFLKLTFDKKFKIQYSQKTAAITQNFKTYKKYMGNIKVAEHDLEKYLCKAVGASTYNRNSKRRNF